MHPLTRRLFLHGSAAEDEAANAIFQGRWQGRGVGVHKVRIGRLHAWAPKRKTFPCVRLSFLHEASAAYDVLLVAQ